jgi:hypothetical protein
MESVDPNMAGQIYPVFCVVDSNHVIGEEVRPISVRRETKSCTYALLAVKIPRAVKILQNAD